MTLQDIEDHIRELMDEESGSPDWITLTPSDNSIHIHFKGGCNPFEIDNTQPNERGEYTNAITLRGRDCQYLTLYHGEKVFDADLQKTVIWMSRVSSYGEYVDTEDKHHVYAILAAPHEVSGARIFIREKLEDDIHGEIAGDLYHIENLAKNLTLPIEQGLRLRLLQRVADFTRTMICTSVKR